jgi:hypothetical protein
MDPETEKAVEAWKDAIFGPSVTVGKKKIYYVDVGCMSYEGAKKLVEKLKKEQNNGF